MDWKKLFQETILKPVAKAVSTASKTARKLVAPLAAAIPKPKQSIHKSVLQTGAAVQRLIPQRTQEAARALLGTVTEPLKERPKLTPGGFLKEITRGQRTLLHLTSIPTSFAEETVSGAAKKTPLKNVGVKIPGTRAAIKAPEALGFLAGLALPIPGGKKVGIGKAIGHNLLKRASSYADELSRTVPRAGRTFRAVIANVDDIKLNRFDIENATRPTMEAAKKALRTGKAKPIVVAADGGVLDGTHRILAARELRIKQLPAVLQSDYGRVLEVAGGRYNLAALNTTDEVFNFIKSSARQNEELITMGRRGKVTFEQTRAAANKLGMTAEKLMKRKPGKAFNDAEIVAAGDILKTNSDAAAHAIRVYQTKLSRGLATDVDRISILQKMNEQSLITSTVLGAKSEAGRALNANKILNEIAKSPLQQNLEKAYKIFKDKDNADQLISRYGHLLATEGEEAAYKFVRSIHKPKGMDYLVEYWYNAILSSPSTHIINSLTNTVSTMLSPIEKTAAAAFDIPVSIIQRRPRARFFGETAADIIGGTAGISHGIRKGLYTLTHGYTVDYVGKLDLGRPEAFLKGKVGAIKPTRWLVAADKFYKGINFEATKYSLSYSQAAKEGLKGKSLLARTAELINDTPSDIIEASGKAAKYRVFQEDPGTITRSVLSLRKASGPVGTFITPFVQTPVNLIKFGIERSPLGLLTNVPRARGAAVSDELAKAFIGST